MRAMAIASVSVLLAVGSGCGDDAKETPGPDPSVTTSGSGGTDATTGSGGNGTGGNATSSSSGSGGGGAGETAAGYVSGSRLKAKFIEGSDGSKQFTTLYDTEKGTDCTYAQTPEGRLCVPPERVTPFTGSTGNLALYRDANCTLQTTKVIPGCADPTHISEGGSCQVVRTWQIDGVISGYRLVNNVCVVNTTGDVYQLTEVPLTDWVEGTEMVE